MRGFKSNPFIYYFHFIEPAIIAAATTSGYVAMQTGIEVCERKLNMDTRISRFSIPFFVTLEVFYFKKKEDLNESIKHSKYKKNLKSVQLVPYSLCVRAYS